jgi:hypothetical protein
MCGLHRARARSLASPALAFDARDVHRATVHRVVDPVAGRRLHRTRLGPAGLVPECDEERGDVFAMSPVARSEGRTRAGRHESAGRELERDPVGLGICSADVATRARVFDDDAVDGMTPDIVVATEVSARAEQTPEGAVIERRECFGER